MEKKLCYIHHYFYEGNECPICRQEKYGRLAKHYVKDSINIDDSVNNEPTEESLNKLIEKFNLR